MRQISQFHSRLRSRYPERCGRRRGNVFALVWLSLLAMLGFCSFAADLGLLVYTKARLQVACDAGALAGAQEMPRSANRAYEIALKTARLNGVADPEISFPSAHQIRVSAKRRVHFLFAAQLGVASSTVSATTVAGRSFSVKGIPEVVPLAITTGAYGRYRYGDSFEVVLVRNNKGAFTDTGVLALDFRVDSEGKSISLFEADLTNGYPGTIYIGDNYNVLNASDVTQSASVVKAMETRFAQSAAAFYGDTGVNYTYPDYPALSRRIITIVVSQERPENNNNPVVPILYFAPVYVEELRQTSGVEKETILRMRILPGRAYSSDDPRVVIGDETTPNTGLTVVKMGE